MQVLNVAGRLMNEERKRLKAENARLREALDAHAKRVFELEEELIVYMNEHEAALQEGCDE